MKISPEKNIEKSSIPNIYEYKKSKAKEVILSTALSLGIILSSSMLSSCDDKKEVTKKSSKIIKYDVEESNYRITKIASSEASKDGKLDSLIPKSTEDENYDPEIRNRIYEIGNIYGQRRSP